MVSKVSLVSVFSEVGEVSVVLLVSVVSEVSMVIAVSELNVALGDDQRFIHLAASVKHQWY